MKFSMIFEAQLANPTREREQRLIHDCLQQAVYGEKMGFDRIWAVEHHALRHRLCGFDKHNVVQRRQRLHRSGSGARRRRNG